MPFPTGWPPPSQPGRGPSLRFYVAAAATANFEDRAYNFAAGAGANPLSPLPTVSATNTPNPTELPVSSDEVPQNPAGTVPSGGVLYCVAIRIINDDGAVTLEYSFDGVTVHGKVLPGEVYLYRARAEAGIAFRGNGADFRCEAW